MSLTIKGKERFYQGKFTSLWGTRFFDNNGKERTWEWIEKKDIIFIFPITEDNKIVLVKSFRVPLEKYVIETPAGIKDSDKSDEEIARQELLEETGYEASKMILLPLSPISPGITNGMAKGFIATGLKKIGTQKLEEAEDMEILEIEADRLTEYCLNLPDDLLFASHILAAYQIAKHLGII